MNDQASVFLIRHAQSKFNVSENAALARGATVYEYKFNSALVDAGISDHGVTQTYEAAKTMKEEEIKIVFTSPLRRCMQTTHFIFKDHPSKPRIIVLPFLREIFSSACDVSDNIHELKKEFPEFDFSFIEGLSKEELWLIYSLENETLKKEFLKELKAFTRESKKQLGERVKEFLLNKIMEYYPAQYESSFDMIKRGAKLKDVVRKFAETLRPGEKMAVVSHFYFLIHFTASNFGDAGEPLDGKSFKNCEVFEFNFCK